MSRLSRVAKPDARRGVLFVPFFSYAAANAPRFRRLPRRHVRTPVGLAMLLSSRPAFFWSAPNGDRCGGPTAASRASSRVERRARHPGAARWPSQAGCGSGGISEVRGVVRLPAPVSVCPWPGGCRRVRFYWRRQRGVGNRRRGGGVPVAILRRDGDDGVAAAARRRARVACAARARPVCPAFRSRGWRSASERRVRAGVGASSVGSRNISEAGVGSTASRSPSFLSAPVRCSPRRRRVGALGSVIRRGGRRSGSQRWRWRCEDVHGAMEDGTRVPAVPRLLHLDRRVARRRLRAHRRVTDTPRGSSCGAAAKLRAVVRVKRSCRARSSRSRHRAEFRAAIGEERRRGENATPSPRARRFPRLRARPRAHVAFGVAFGNRSSPAGRDALRRFSYARRGSAPLIRRSLPPQRGRARCVAVAGASLVALTAHALEGRDWV